MARQIESPKTRSSTLRSRGCSLGLPLNVRGDERDPLAVERVDSKARSATAGLPLTDGPANVNLDEAVRPMGAPEAVRRR
jgi:hypothetical protein